MVDKTNITAFMSRWRISLPDERVFLEFRTRVTNVIVTFQNEWAQASTPDLIALEKVFAAINGSTYRSGTGTPRENMGTYIGKADTFLQLVLVLQRIFWSVQEYRRMNVVQHEQAYAVNMLVTRLNQVLDYSHGINVRKLELTDAGVDLYPQGVPVLDRELVDTPVAWLQEFPEVAAEYKTALLSITTKDAASLRQALDALRFALEKLLKLVLSNNAPLEKQKQPLLAWLKERGIHAQIRNNYATILDQFATFQNDFVKHDNDPTTGRTYSLSETEYMVYLTGALIRLVLQVRAA